MFVFLFSTTGYNNTIILTKLLLAKLDKLILHIRGRLWNFQTNYPDYYIDR